MFKRLFPLLFLFACEEKNLILEEILTNGSPSFKETIENPKHEIQIIYGEIKSDTIIHHYHQVDPNHFFYPASTVKMLAAFAAIERLSRDTLSLQTQIRIDSQRYHPVTLSYDSLFQGPMTIENLLKKIFVFSDNQAYNVFYRWLGKDHINQTHKTKGMDSRVIHQLSERAFSFPKQANNYSYSVELKDSRHNVSESQSSQTWESDLFPINQIRGKGYVDSVGNQINKPFDFSQKNFVPLASLLGSLERVVKPELFRPGQKYNWAPTAYQEVHDIMRLRPKTLPSPVDTLPDNYVKFFLVGDLEEEVYPEDITILNKVGWAYGYLTDIAYIQDTNEGIAFFLAATIHVNENEIYNDGVYEYKEIGIPFLAELGRLIYQYELSK